MQKSQRARIKDVAKLAGVSNMTVSRVLNGIVKVSDAKKQAVLQAVKQLDYKPDSSARRLGGHKSYMVGLLYKDLNISYVSRFILTALQSCNNHGHYLVAQEVNDSTRSSLQSIIHLIEIKQIESMVLLPPISDNIEIIELLRQYQVPFIRIAPNGNFDLSPYICIDEYLVGYKMTEHLINLGHTKIAHIIGHIKQGSSHLRCQGYLDALKRNNIEPYEKYTAQGTFTFDSGVEAAKQLLALDDKPSAIFAANDEMAAAVILVANQLGIKIPEELSVAGVDDTQLAVTLSPNLTTIKQPIAEMAELAVSILAENEVNKIEKSHYRNILNFDLIQRDSAIPLD